jgi:hypothetical protein
MSPPRLIVMTTLSLSLASRTSRAAVAREPDLVPIFRKRRFDVPTPGLGRVFVIALILLLAVGFVALALIDVPPKQRTIETELPRERLSR